MEPILPRGECFRRREKRMVLMLRMEDGRECGDGGVVVDVVDEEVVEVDLVEAVVLEREGVRQWKGP